MSKNRLNSFLISHLLLFGFSIIFRFHLFLSTYPYFEIETSAALQLISFDILYSFGLVFSAFRLYEQKANARLLIVTANVGIIFVHLLMPAFFAWYTETGIKASILLVVRPIGILISCWAGINCFLAIRPVQPMLSASHLE